MRIPPVRPNQLHHAAPYPGNINLKSARAVSLNPWPLFCIAHSYPDAICTPPCRLRPTVAPCLVSAHLNRGPVTRWDQKRGVSIFKIRGRFKPSDPLFSLSFSRRDGTWISLSRRQPWTQWPTLIYKNLSRAAFRNAKRRQEEERKRRKQAKKKWNKTKKIKRKKKHVKKERKSKTRRG